MRRRHLLALGLTGLAASATGLVGCSSGIAPPPTKETPVPQPVTYGDGPSQYGELSLPSGPGPFPVVVVIHGGFWSASYDLQLGRSLAEDLARHGVAAWNIEYRRVGRGDGGGGGWPATGADVAAAVDRLHGMAQLDLSRVVALGHSAGGQLAGWLGGRKDPKVALTGIVSQAGVLDLVAAADLGLGGSATQSLLGGEPADIPDVYADASPLAHVPLGIPSVCVHGTADANVPPSQSQSFVTAAQKAGDDAELVTLEGADHFDLITVGRPGWNTCRDATLHLLNPAS